LDDIFDVFVENAWADAEKKELFKLLRVREQQDVAYAERIAYGVNPTTLRAIGPLNIHTSSSAASKWIPYEFGRAKNRPLRSTHGGGLNMWLQNRNAGERILGPTRPLLR
jgi:hypothetical protein